jgi:hypothetical protein
MIISWGTKTVYDPIGYVADFCPCCRELRVFHFRRIGSATHLYGIAADSGDLTGYDRRCQSCGIMLSAVPDWYTGTSDEVLPIDELQSKTNARYRDTYAVDIALDRKAHDTPNRLTAEERQERIRDLFDYLAVLYEQRYRQDRASMGQLMGLALGFFSLLIFGGIAMNKLSSLFSDEPVPILNAIPLIVAIGIPIWWRHRADKEFRATRVMPRFASVLGPLRPTEAELTQAFEALRSRRVGLLLKPIILHKLKIADVRQHLDAVERGAIS